MNKKEISSGISDSSSSVDYSGSTTSRMFSLAYQNNIQPLKNFLNENNELDLLSIIDNKQLLHISCLNNELAMLEIILNFVEIKHKNDEYYTEKITKWVNLQNKEGFTALHFASFRGNIADPNIYNNQGLNVVHVAAQGDKVASLAYFKEKGFSLTILDKKGSSPLHWACYLSSENAALFLTKYLPKEELLIPDNEGKFTPLHLAVISGNGKIVRRLLSKGANENIEDKFGRKPLSISSIFSVPKCSLF